MLPSYSSGSRVVPRHHANIPNGYPRRKDDDDEDHKKSGSMHLNFKPHLYAVCRIQVASFTRWYRVSLTAADSFTDTNHEAHYQPSDGESDSSFDSA